MDRSLRLRHGPPAVLRTGEQGARRQGLRSGSLDRLRLRSRDGPAGHDSVRHSRYPPLRAERSAVSETVRMKFSVNWLGEFVDLPAKQRKSWPNCSPSRASKSKGSKHAARISTKWSSPRSMGLPPSERGQTQRLRSGRRQRHESARSSAARPITKWATKSRSPCRERSCRTDWRFVRKQTARGRIRRHALQPNRARPGRTNPVCSFFRRMRRSARPSDLFPSDTILDVEITPNRGDLLSHFGLAREIAALTEGNLTRRRANRKFPSGRPA